MKYRFRILCWSIIALTISWTTGSLADDSNKSYYAQHTFYVFKDRYDSTNYHTDTLVPINTEIKVTDMNGKAMKFVIPSMGDLEISFKNIKKYSKMDMEGSKNRLLGTKKVDLSKYSKKIQDAINNGEILTGMTKQEVLLAYGYPPAHVTPNTESNQWTYWKTRWNKMIVYFKDNKVDRIKD